MWAKLQNKDVGDYKFYALNDSDAQIRSAFIINGLLNTFEILNMSGHKIKSFGVREFLMAGFFNSNQPLTLFIAKVLLSIISGGLTSGCNAGLGISAGVFALVVFLRRKK